MLKLKRGDINGRELITEYDTKINLNEETKKST